MLSPASLRVCCLAVMAPALTKADRQADCLPVVLSESFCIPKTPDTYNITARISESPLKCAVTPDYSHNKRRPFMHRACWRTQKSGSGVLCKYRTIGNDSSKSLLYINRVRTQKDTKHKTWLSTKAITAYAGKIKLKYTMNKNTSSFRNMGLAKANTSLGLQSLKKLKRFSKENQSSGPINVMDDSLTFSDSADSSVQIETVIENTNSDSNVLPVDNDSVPCVSSNGRTSAVSDVLDTLNTVSESMASDSQPFLSAGADVIEALNNTSVTLTDLLKSSVENPESSTSPQISVSSLPCSVPVECTEDVLTVNNDVPEAVDSDLQPEMSDLTVEHSEPDISLENDAIQLETCISKQVSNSIFTKFSDFKLPNSNSQYSGNPVKASSLYSVINSSKLLTNASRLSQVSDNQIKCPYIIDSRFGSNLLVPSRKNKDMCCLLSSQELESLRQTLNEKSLTVNSAVSSSTRLLTKYLSAHMKKQMSSLVEHYQRSLHIPCQRPAKHASLKSNKHVVDVQAELLQNEEVKSMSTAELVKFVHEIKGTQIRTSTPKTAFSSNVPESSDIVPLSFSVEDCEDIKQTSGVWSSVVKNVLRESDPYLTESSDEEYELESDEEETAPSETETAESEDPLWKYLMNRTKLGSRSTWLLARVHELEFRIKEYTERWNELVKAEGNVSFEEESAEVLNSSLCESDETSLRTTVKQTSLKNFLLPLNGFLDRNDASHIARDPLESELDSMKDSGSSVETDVCCRTRALNTSAFRKRKIVYVPGLHDKSPKFSRSSTVNCICNCQSNLAPCILCTGQHNSIQSVDPESMALRDRIAILDPFFHPALSEEKDIPFGLHVENVLKLEAKYNVRPPSLEENSESEEVQPGLTPKYQDFRSHRKLSRYTRSLSAKYRNKHHRTTKHLRKHKLVFGKWRRLQNKHALRARNRFRRHSIASSGSSPESTVNSPLSVYDDGFGSDNKKKRGDDSQFDIDDVIIPCNSRSGRLVEIQYKEIMIPSWRSLEDGTLASETIDDLENENITDAYFIKKHDQLEVEEKEKMKRTALGLNKRLRRNRCDSRADSSGANTPDPTSLYNNQDNVFQTPNFNISAGPASPASPATPNSAVVSDDSQSAFGNNSTTRPEKKKIILIQKRTIEESSNARNLIDFDEVPPFELRQFPLSEEKYEEMLAESDHYREVFDMPSNASSFPASPMSSSSTSTVEEEEEEGDDDDDDVTDPEWTVVKPIRSCPEQALVLKFAKR